MVQLSNFTVTAVSKPPALIGRDGRFTATDTTRNTAGVPTPVFTTRYYLSLDGAGAVTVTLPANATDAAVYFLLACADDLGVVPESSEPDNCRASSTQVTVQVPG